MTKLMKTRYVENRTGEVLLETHGGATLYKAPGFSHEQINKHYADGFVEKTELPIIDDDLQRIAIQVLAGALDHQHPFVGCAFGLHNPDEIPQTVYIGFQIDGVDFSATIYASQLNVIKH